ncbi:hypothetical protein [Candidatus Cyanaurora vandensis]|uniref:hypothetical protein n=1 Tax=Candidatus Cyanaurora vandensis TaxID=2714958 RepID=UPI002580F829|nr:hypothetical protein [Candidatus Cyanaurora vandensis]
MQKRPNAGRIRPKLSSIPRRETPASNYLELHKLALEKSRLEDEIRRMDLRRSIIQDHLTALQQHMQERVRLAAPPAPTTPTAPTSPVLMPPLPRGIFELLDLKY